MVIVGKQGIRGDLVGERQRLAQLLADLDGIAAGRRPSPAQLAAAPSIEGWGEAVRPELCLVGQIHGHPVCHGPLSVTSGLVVWAPELGWMRTQSRFYRLGSPHEDGEKP